jgi:large subunit ribosomal protein L17
MKKKIFGRQFKRDKNERQALFKGLLSSLVLEERIETTEQKAKSIKADAEKLVIKAKKELVLAKKLLGKKLHPAAIEKMITSVAPRFDNRSGGYTRIIRIGKRFGDDANMVILEWVEKPLENLEPKAKKEKKVKTKKEVKKTEPKKEVAKKETKSKVATKSKKVGKK